MSLPITDIQYMLLTLQHRKKFGYYMGFAETGTKTRPVTDPSPPTLK